MTFSEFAKILQVYCREEEKSGDFIVSLTNMFMAGQPGREHEDGTHQNPMYDKDDRTRLAILNGERSISQKDASIILSSMDKDKFERFIRKHCSDHAQKALLDEISKIREGIKPSADVAEVCSDLLEEILHDLASGVKS